MTEKQRKHFEVFDALCEDPEISTLTLNQLRFLAYMARAEPAHPPTHAELARALRLTPATITRTTYKLMASRHLAQCEYRDRRTASLCMTQKGKALDDRIGEIMANICTPQHYTEPHDASQHFITSHVTAQNNTRD